MFLVMEIYSYFIICILVQITYKEFSVVQFISHIPLTHCTHVHPIHCKCLHNLDTLSYSDNKVVLINTFFIHLFTILQLINITYKNKKQLDIANIQIQEKRAARLRHQQ